MGNFRGPVNVGRLLGSNKPDGYFLEFRLETDTGEVPDVVDPDYNEVTITREGTGSYRLEFDETVKPFSASVIAFHEEDDADLRVVTEGYDSDNGRVNFKTYTNSGGTWSAADTDDDTLVLWLFCTRSTNGVD